MQSGLQDGRPSAQDAPCGKRGGCRGWNWGPVGRGTPARPQGVLRPWGPPSPCRLRRAWPPCVLVWWLRLRSPHCFRASPAPLPPAPGVRTPSVAPEPLLNSGSSLPARIPVCRLCGQSQRRGGRMGPVVAPHPPWEVRACRHSGAQGPLPLPRGSGRGPLPCGPSRCSVALVSWVFPGETRLSQGSVVRPDTSQGQVRPGSWALSVPTGSPPP